MKNQQQCCNCMTEVDRMINEGLGNGSINPKYTEAHLKLKEKQDKILLSGSLEKEDSKSSISV